MLVHSAGLALIYNNKILLIHPTNASWKNACGIPKGKIEEGESILDAAIRETREEVGFIADETKLEEEDEQVFFYVNKKGKKSKKISFWIYRMSTEEYSNLISKKDVVPRSKLCLREVDWAGFMNAKKAKEMILHNQMCIIKSVFK